MLLAVARVTIAAALIVGVIAQEGDVVGDVDVGSGAPSTPPPPVVSTCPCIGDTSSIFDGAYRPAGWAATCAAWNEDSQGLNYTTKSCDVSDPPDWCADMWCYVDASCTGAATYASTVPSAQSAGLKWSYKACDVEFAGNTYVGFCECTGVTGTFGPNGAVTVRPYGWGGSCAAWNENAEVGLGFTTPSCNVSSPPDWCSDAWCYVDADKCTPWEPKTSSFGAGAYPWSYATCDKYFGGNTYVGFPPPPPPPKDGNAYSIVSFTATGDVSDFDAATIASIEAVFATLLSVDPSMVVVDVSSGSVVITATIQASSVNAAKTATSTLSSTLTSAAATNTFLSSNGVTGVTATSAPTVSSTVAGSGGLSGGAIASIVVPVVLVFIALVTCAYLKISKDQAAEKLITTIKVEGDGDGYQLEDKSGYGKASSAKASSAYGKPSEPAGYSGEALAYAEPTNAAAV